MDESDETPSVIVNVRRDLRKLQELFAETEIRVEPQRLGVPEPRPAGFIGPMPEAVRRVKVTGSRLLTAAVAAGDDPEMPGGAAMVALASVSSMEPWSYKLDTAEQIAEARSWRTGTPLEHVEVYDDDEWEPPLQTLLYWSEQWRQLTGMEPEQVKLAGGTYADRRPTVASEVNFLRWALDWAYADPVERRRFPKFADDVARARRRVEDMLRDGVRAERGVPCLYEECGGVRLVRKLVPGRDEDGNKVWYHSKWHCPRCHRQWDEDEYARMKTAAAEAAKIEHIPTVVGTPDDPIEESGDTWCSLEYAARRTGRPAATIRVWAHRGRVASVCVVAGRRRGYVRVADVDEQHALAERRAEAVRAGKRRKRGHTTMPNNTDDQVNP